jgi:CheY-like chemotaxis protein
MSRILFVDDEVKVLDGLRRLLRPMRGEWETRFVPGPLEALAELERAPADVVVTDMRMPVMDGAALLAACQERWPGTVRIVLSGHAKLDAVLRALPSAHQCLAKPCDPEVLRGVISQACEVSPVVHEPLLRRRVGGLTGLPVRPGSVAALSDALAAAALSYEDVATVVKSDVGLAVKALQISSWALFDAPRRVTDLDLAASLLSPTLLRSLLPHLPVAAGDSGWDAQRLDELERVHARSRLAARLAAALAAPPDTGGAFAAGLLHDVGDLARLAVHDVAMDRALALRLGAHVLNLWGIPRWLRDAVVRSAGVPDGARLAGDLACVVRVARLLVAEERATAACALSHPAWAPDASRWREMAAREAERVPEAVHAVA